MKKAAITGANGFIGSRLSSYLHKKGYDVRCLVRTGSDISLLEDFLTIVYVDYNDTDDLEKAFDGIEIIIHLAALTRAKKWEQFQKINIDLVETIVQLANASDTVEQFIFMSSQAAAGPSLSGVGKTETEECRPVTMYGNSKLEAEEIVQEQCTKAWTILRPVSVFGPGEKDFLQYYQVLSKSIAPLVGLRQKYISLIYVDDLCRMTELAIGKDAAKNETFFAAGSESMTMSGFAYLIAQALDVKVYSIRVAEPVLWVAAILGEIAAYARKRPPVLNREKFREMQQRYWLASNHKAENLLGFTQNTTLVKQMQTTIDWYKDRGML